MFESYWGDEAATREVRPRRTGGFTQATSAEWKDGDARLIDQRARDFIVTAEQQDARAPAWIEGAAARQTLRRRGGRVRPGAPVPDGRSSRSTRMPSPTGRGAHDIAYTGFTSLARADPRRRGG